MEQKGAIPVVSTTEKHSNEGYTNPYTFSSSALAAILASIINTSHEFSIEPSAHDDLEAEIERIRLYNETILYAARVCEVAIKQMLYCTQIPESQYKRMALGNLLESPCPNCKKQNGKTPHSISLVGSLAHPFYLCSEFDECALNHMDLVNKLRNTQAAHSDIQTLNIRSPEESKAQCFADCQAVLSDLKHLLSHLGKLETMLMKDIAQKGADINILKLNGLPAADCNFILIPGERMEHEMLALIYGNTHPSYARL
jgi:hypothetical protein